MFDGFFRSLCHANIFGDGFVSSHLFGEGFRFFARRVVDECSLNVSYCARGFELSTSLWARTEDGYNFAILAREQVYGCTAARAGADGSQGTAFEQGNRATRI